MKTDRELLKVELANLEMLSDVFGQVKEVNSLKRMLFDSQLIRMAQLQKDVYKPTLQ